MIETIQINDNVLKVIKKGGRVELSDKEREIVNKRSWFQDLPLIQKKGLKKLGIPSRTK